MHANFWKHSMGLMPSKTLIYLVKRYIKKFEQFLQAFKATRPGYLTSFLNKPSTPVNSYQSAINSANPINNNNAPPIIAALIFLSGGMNIAWSIGFDSLADELVISTHLRISWFIGAIIGSLLGIVVARHLTYKLLMVSVWFHIKINILINIPFGLFSNSAACSQSLAVFCSLRHSCKLRLCWLHVTLMA